ncbi:hypothetical protein ACQKQC_06525 [Vibrio fortis]|uniref:hypothetical protein n=1 Tax=Vibrio fortis TaxID=212667 RepID=UPI003375E2BB|nr:conserved hypothetical protein [Vibrio chagasii]
MSNKKIGAIEFYTVQCLSAGAMLTASLYLINSKLPERPEALEVLTNQLSVIDGTLANHSDPKVVEEILRPQIKHADSIAGANNDLWLEIHGESELQFGASFTGVEGYKCKDYVVNEIFKAEQSSSRTMRVEVKAGRYLSMNLDTFNHENQEQTKYFCHKGDLVSDFVFTSTYTF